MTQSLHTPDSEQTKSELFRQSLWNQIARRTVWRSLANIPMNKWPVPPETDPSPPQVEEIKPPWGQEAVFAVYPHMQAYVFSRVGELEGDAVVGEVLKVLLRDCGKVTATTRSGFFSWCYGVARNKVIDEYRSRSRGGLVAIEPDELMVLIDKTTESSALSPGVLSDLRFILDLVRTAKSPCVELLQEHILFGVDAKIMAANYGISIGAMNRRIERCFALAQQLAKKHP